MKLQALALSAALLFGTAAFAQTNPPADNNGGANATQTTPSPNNTTAPMNKPIQTAYGHHGADGWGGGWGWWGLVGLLGLFGLRGRGGRA